MSLSRLAPRVGVASLAAAACFAPAASAAACSPVRIETERAGAKLPPDWSRALTDLAEATAMEGQAWSCTGGALTLAVDAGGRSATLTLLDASGRRVARKIPRAEDLVPSAKALLATPEVEPEVAPAVAPPPPPPPAPETKPSTDAALAPAPPIAASPTEPRFLVDALLGARYRKPEDALWGAGALRLTIPFGAWSAGFWLRGAIPASLEGHGEKHNRVTSEATLGVSGGRRLISGPFELRATIDPSLTFAFQPRNIMGQPGLPNPPGDLSVHIFPQLGLGLHGTFPLAGPLRGAVALDGQFLPATVGAGLSLGVEAVIR